jgi:hypothetical protein
MSSYLPQMEVGHWFIVAGCIVVIAGSLGLLRSLD